MDIAQVFPNSEIVLDPQWILPASSFTSQLPFALIEHAQLYRLPVYLLEKYCKLKNPLPRVLLAEDDDDLRSVMQAILQANGFEVTACHDGEKAERAFGSGSRFDLLLTDLEMPGMSGADLALHLTGRKPPLPVVIVSGATLTASRLDEFAVQGWSFISKPFEIAHLLGKIHALLGFGPASTGHSLTSVWGAKPAYKDGQQAALSESPNGSENGEAKRRVLLIGDDPLLQRTREKILQRAGYDVSLSNSSSCIDETVLSSISLVLICRSVATPNALAIETTIHATAPLLPILRFARPEEEFLGNTSLVSFVAAPEYLLTEVKRLIGH